MRSSASSEVRCTECSGSNGPGLGLGLSNLPPYVGAYWQVTGNLIVLNEGLVAAMRANATSPLEFNSFVYVILAHEYLHSLGYLDERRGPQSDRARDPERLWTGPRGDPYGRGGPLAALPVPRVRSERERPAPQGRFPVRPREHSELHPVSALGTSPRTCAGLIFAIGLLPAGPWSSSTMRSAYRDGHRGHRAPRLRVDPSRRAADHPRFDPPRGGVPVPVPSGHPPGQLHRPGDRRRSGDCRRPDRDPILPLGRSGASADEHDERGARRAKKRSSPSRSNRTIFAARSKSSPRSGPREPTSRSPSAPASV